MRVQLGELAAAPTTFERARDPSRRPERVRIARVEALSGEAEWSGGDFDVERASVAHLALAELVWTFGRVALTAADGGEFLGLAGSARREHGALTLSLRAESLFASPLAVAFGSVAVDGELDASGLALSMEHGHGRLTSERAVFRSLSLRMPELELTIPELVVSGLSVAWGGGLQVEAATAHAARIALRRGDAATTTATATLERVELAALSLHGGELAIGQLRVARAEVSADLARLLHARPRNGSAQSNAAAAAKTSERRWTSLLDTALLDALGGRIEADVHADLTVPVLGRRRAKHELRLDVERGAIDYRALEHGLATLEDSLLDFSVREGALMLERGIPLIATRGRGKPLLVWDLSPADLALAEQQRVRLVVLPRFRPARTRDDDDPPSEEGGSQSSVALRELSVRNIDLALALLGGAPAKSGALRELTFTTLTVRGEVRHEASAELPPGELRVGVSRLRAVVEGLPVGARSLRGRLEIGALRDGQLGFLDLRPRTVVATVEDLALASFALGASERRQA